MENTAKLPPRSIIRGRTTGEMWHLGAAWQYADEATFIDGAVHKPPSVAPLRREHFQNISKEIKMTANSDTVVITNAIYRLPSYADIRYLNIALSKQIFTCAHDSEFGRMLSPCQSRLDLDHNIMS